jgi:hypothetical protein
MSHIGPVQPLAQGSSSCPAQPCPLGGGGRERRDDKQQQRGDREHSTSVLSSPKICQAGSDRAARTLQPSAPEQSRRSDDSLPDPHKLPTITPRRATPPLNSVRFFSPPPPRPVARSELLSRDSLSRRCRAPSPSRTRPSSTPPGPCSSSVASARRPRRSPSAPEFLRARSLTASRARPSCSRPRWRRTFEQLEWLADLEARVGQGELREHLHELGAAGVELLPPAHAADHDELRQPRPGRPARGPHPAEPPAAARPAAPGGLLRGRDPLGRLRPSTPRCSPACSSAASNSTSSSSSSPGPSTPCRCRCRPSCAASSTSCGTAPAPSNLSPGQPPTLARSAP